MRARHPMSNAAAQDVCGCSVSIAVGWAALSQSRAVTSEPTGAWQLRWEARGAGCWSAGLSLSATPRCGNSQETRARNLHTVSSVEGLSGLSLPPSLWISPPTSLPPVLSGMEGSRTEHILLLDAFISHAPLLLFRRTPEPLIPTAGFKFLPGHSDLQKGSCSF